MFSFGSLKINSKLQILIYFVLFVYVSLFLTEGGAEDYPTLKDCTNSQCAKNGGHCKAGDPKGPIWQPQIPSFDTCTCE